ncbi:MAG: TonB-dependent receptor [Pseudomonadales bacterium]
MTSSINNREFFPVRIAIFTLLLLTSFSSLAHESEDDSIENVIVNGHRHNTIGDSLTASEGIIGSAEIESRPTLRGGEILESVPGMVVTQHSGSGKANQYFLRGFNLDHGTDFSTAIDDMPVNMRTHGHGQGYTDLNFIVPELINDIGFRKGPYYAEVGDFSGAGAAAFNLKNTLQSNLLTLQLGEDNFQRLLSANSFKAGAGNLLFAVEAQFYDGPWEDISEDVEKLNVLGRYTDKLAAGQLSVTVMAYDNSWNSADQIPERAVRQRLIDRLGSLDTDVGGASSRYSLSANWRSEQWRAGVYAIRSDLELFSNFTYLLDDPLNGDQFEQADQRDVFGGSVKRSWKNQLAGKQMTQLVGAEFRYDDIDEVALYKTLAGRRLATVREDSVGEGSVGLFAQTEIVLTPKLTLNAGARYDYYDVDVDSEFAANSGTADDDLVSIKGGISYAFAERLAAYVNAGTGFHSNDARGATINIDPVSGEAAETVDLLVQSEGAEVGLKFYDALNFNVSTALWYLELDSELLFVGDAGNTEASRASKRYGLEVAAYYWLNDVWSFDLELAWSRSKFTEEAPGEGEDIEGSVPFVASAGVSYAPATDGWHGALRYRHFGARTLDSFDTVDADATSVVNLGVGYRFRKFNIGIDLLNLLDSDDHDIDYFYSSRLAGEPAEGVEDIHYHPVEPRTLRLEVSFSY